MIKHIVTFKLTGTPAERKEVANKFKDALMALPLHLSRLVLSSKIRQPQLPIFFVIRLLTLGTWRHFPLLDTSLSDTEASLLSFVLSS